MNTMTPIAFSVQRTDYTDTLLALFLWRTDWFGHNPHAYRLYHLTAFDCDEGATEYTVRIPRLCLPIVGKENAERAWLEHTGEEIAEEAFEGRVG